MISFFLHLQGGSPRTTSRPPDASRDGAARLRLSGEVLVCVSLSAAECRLERFVSWQQQMLLYTHSNPFTNFLFFTPTQYGTFIHTPPQHNLSLITHRVNHRLRVLHRHGVSAGARPGSLLRSGAEVVRRLPPCRCKKNEITEP